MSLTAPALLAYFQVPLEGPYAEQGRAWLTEAWRALGDELGFDAPIAVLGVGTELPSGDFSGLGAARERHAAEVWQAAVRVEHDVLCLTVMMAPGRDQDCAQAWANLEGELLRIAAPSRGVLGEIRVFLALRPQDEDATASVRAAMPGETAIGWWRRRDTVDHAHIWEAGAPSDERAVRRLVLVASEEFERRVDRLVWTNGDSELAPLARHLLHAAKLRYQIRVFADGRKAEGIHDGVRRMRRGVGIIAENLGNALGHRLETVDGPIADDRALADWFTTRLDDALDDLAVKPLRPLPRHSPTSAPCVFISYMHDSEQHKTDVRQLAELLQDNGIDVHYDQRYPDLRRDWYLWMIANIDQADFVIVVASPICRLVGDGKIESDRNLGGQSEMGILRELLHSDRSAWTRKLLPVVLPGRRIDDIPLFLQPRTADHYVVSDYTTLGAGDVLRTVGLEP